MAQALFYSGFSTELPLLDHRENLNYCSTTLATPGTNKKDFFNFSGHHAIFQKIIFWERHTPLFALGVGTSSCTGLFIQEQNNTIKKNPPGQWPRPCLHSSVLNSVLTPLLLQYTPALNSVLLQYHSLEPCSIESSTELPLLDHTH